MELPAIRWTELQNWQRLEPGHKQYSPDSKYSAVALDEQKQQEEGERER